MMNRTKKLSLKLIGVVVLVNFSSALWANTTNNRLVSVERITQSHTQLLQELQNQLNDANQDIDTLRGEVQLLQYQLQQTIARQKEILLQLANTPSETVATSASTAASDTTQIQNSNGIKNAQLNHGVDARQAEKTANEQQVTTKNNSHSHTPVTTTATTQTTAPLITKNFEFSGNDKTDYDAIMALILTDKNYYPEGITALQQFVKRYPNSRYLPNAYYWLGQLNYIKGDKDSAVFYFATVVKDYPKSEKTSDAMYKVAILLQDKGQLNDAKAIYQQLLNLYPKTPVAIQAQRKLDSLSKNSSSQ